MNVRALIVDDEPPARARLRQLLDAHGGVTVVGEAASGAEALELIRERRPDVLFLDIEMPEMRGTTLAASLPEPRPFVVFATAYERYAVDAFACDATDYLLKPITRERLLEAGAVAGVALMGRHVAEAHEPRETTDVERGSIGAPAAESFVRLPQESCLGLVVRHVRAGGSEERQEDADACLLSMDSETPPQPPPVSPRRGRRAPDQGASAW